MQSHGRRLLHLLFPERSGNPDESGENVNYGSQQNQYSLAKGDHDSDEDEEMHDMTFPESQTVSVWKSAFNVMNFMTGSGFVTIPYAVKLGGITALLSLAAVPCVLWYTGVLLIDCLYGRTSVHGDKIRVRSTYKEIGEASLPHVGGILVDIYIYTVLFLIPVSYFILCGQLLFFIQPSVSETTWVLIVAAVVLPTIFIEKLGQVAWLSVVGMAAVLGVVGTAVCYGASRTTLRLVGHHSSQLLFWDAENVAVAVGISYFCYGSHVMLTDMEEHMLDRRKFGTALFGGYATLSIIKIIFALVVFWAFGQNTLELVMYNLPTGFVRMAATTLYVVSIVFTFALPVHAYMHNLEHTRLAEHLMSIVPRVVWFIGLRLVLFLLALLIAIQVRHFALFAAFLGSLLMPLGTTVFPPAFHLLIKYEELNLWQITVDVIIIIAGLLMWVVLIFLSTKKLFASF